MFNNGLPECLELFVTCSWYCTRTVQIVLKSIFCASSALGMRKSTTSTVHWRCKTEEQEEEKQEEEDQEEGEEEGRKKKVTLTLK